MDNWAIEHCSINTATHATSTDQQWDVATATTVIDLNDVPYCLQIQENKSKQKWLTCKYHMKILLSRELYRRINFKLISRLPYTKQANVRLLWDQRKLTSQKKRNFYRVKNYVSTYIQDVRVAYSKMFFNFLYQYGSPFLSTPMQRL